MSHAYGQVFRPEGQLVGWFEFNASVNVPLSRIFPTQEELSDNWRQPVTYDAKCSCGGEPVQVVLYTDYGGGFYWPSKACLPCCCILDQRVAECYDGMYCPDGYHDGHPFEE